MALVWSMILVLSTSRAIMHCFEHIFMHCSSVSVEPIVPAGTRVGRYNI